MLTHTPIEYVPVIVASLVAFPVGMLWFSPLLFGKAWARMNKLSPQMMKQGSMAGPLTASYISALIMSFTIWVLLGVMAIDVIAPAISLVFILWLAFNFFPSLSHGLFAKKPVALVLINTSYELVNALLMTVILTYWHL